MMNLDNYYLHSTGRFNGSDNKQNGIISILRDGKIRAAKYGEYYKNKVCLCDPIKAKEEICGITLIRSFICYTEKSPTICLNKNLKVEKPNLALDIGNNTTNIYDEVRHNGDISLENCAFITFPIWPVEYNLIVEDAIPLPVRATWKIENLNIFKENMKIIAQEFSTFKVKDLYSGVDLTTDFIDERIKEFKKV